MAFQILIVDDDREFRQEMRECLHMYRVLEAASGQEAINLIKNPNAVDLVILDFNMPGFNGIETLQEMRKLNSHLSVIICTGEGSKEVAIDALRAHADDYVEKSFLVDKFLTIVHKILNKKTQTLTACVNKIERVKLFIDRNGDKKITLKDAAEEVCLSPKYLSRIFQEKTGVSFNVYRAELKINKAIELLVKSLLSVERISRQLGYKNPQSFIRMFRKLKGCTPALYRQKNTRLKTT